MPPYLTVDDAYDALIGLPSIRAFVSINDELFLRILLEMSVGIDLSGQKVYRIFWVAARFLLQTQTVLEESSFQEASCKYADIQRQIDDLLNLQNSQDLAYKVPAGFEAFPLVMGGAFEAGVDHWNRESTIHLLEKIEFYHA
jgi:hypothetical protein